MAANTFIELNDVPSTYTTANSKFLRVNSTATGIQFWNVSLFDLEDVSAQGAYAPQAGDALVWSAAGQEWRPGDMDVYTAGNGLNKSLKTLSVVAGYEGGLTSNTNGVFITDIANVSGTWGNATHHPVFTVNSKGQITGISNVESTINIAESLNASYVGNVVGTSGQITVTGGTGINSNATLNLVATGVTAGTYGNATHIPQITVDTYGRIQNIDLVLGSGGSGGSGGNSNVLTYKNIVVAGQTMLSADQFEDTLTFADGGGFTITTNAATDTITFSANGEALVANVSIGDFHDVDTSGITDGQVLKWNAVNGSFEPSDVLDASGVSAGTYTGGISSVTVDAEGRITSITGSAGYLTSETGDISEVIAGTGLVGGGTSGSVTLNLDQSGVAAGTYGNATTVPSITVDALGRVTSVSNTSITLANTGVTAKTYGNATNIPVITVGSDGRVTSVSNVSVASHIQSLGWNAGTYQLTISGGNTVDLSVLAGSGSGSGNSNVSSIADLTDVGSTSGISDGQALLWNSSNGQFEYGNVVASGTANAFSTIAVSGQTSISSSGEDTLTLVAGTGVSIETNVSAQSVTINSTGIVNQGLDFGTFTSPVGFTLDMGAF